MTQSFDRIELLENLLKIPGGSGAEIQVAAFLQKTCLEWGLSPDCMLIDDVAERIDAPCTTGNLLIRIPERTSGPRILISSHMDTVPPCAGAEPKREGRKIVPRGQTALGGDNRTGVAAMMSLIHAILREKCPHPPLTFLFTIREESGLQGARAIEPGLLRGCKFGINIDGGSPYEGTIAAVGANRFTVDIEGKASHAGVYPERGISALLIGALGMAKSRQEGWFGKIQKGEKQGSSNIGIAMDRDGGAVGQATNVVTDFLRLRGEARSMDRGFIAEITEAFRSAFAWAAAEVRDDQNQPGKIDFQFQTEYEPFEIEAGSPVIELYQKTVRSLGIEPVLKKGRGGLDANWLFRHEVPSLTIGAGQNQIHAIGEWVNLDHYEGACDLLLALMKSAAST